jgi:hypothetical protein
VPAALGIPLELGALVFNSPGDLERFLEQQFVQMRQHILAEVQEELKEVKAELEGVKNLRAGMRWLMGTDNEPR